MSVAVGRMGFGVGKQAPSLVASLAEEVPERLLHFGDLDPKGLQIAADTARAAAEAGLPPLRLHARLYQMLVELGRPQARRRGEQGWSERGLAWFGRSPASLEWVGRAKLRADLADLACLGREEEPDL